MKVGQKLIAITDCEMSYVGGSLTGDYALTIGKEYEVISSEYDEFEVINDQGEPHSFTDDCSQYDDYTEFFEKVEEE
jgi:hypothetical protein